MAFLTHAVIFILTLVLCSLHSDAQSVPDRCWCQSTSTKAFRWKNIEEFSLIAPRSRCKVTEIILTLKTVNVKTKAKEQRCISPNIYQGEQLLECWNRVNIENKRSTIRLSECGPIRPATNKVENTTTVRQL